MTLDDRRSRKNGLAKPAKKSSNRHLIIWDSVRPMPGEPRREWAERAAKATIRGLEERAKLVRAEQERGRFAASREAEGDDEK